MTGKLKSYLAAFARLQNPSLAECVNKSGKILIPFVEYIPVCEIAYPVRSDGDCPGFVLELYSLLQHPWMEYVGIA